MGPRSERVDPTTLPYRPCVGVMLLNAAGHVFVARRNDNYTDAWQMPQGGIDGDEDPRVAAFRELREEIGTDKAEVIAECPRWLNYDLPSELLGKIWKGRYRGQTQKWFAMRFLGTDAEIDLEATDHPEFLEWRWVAMAELPALIVPFKRPVYEDLVVEFGHLAV